VIEEEIRLIPTDVGPGGGAGDGFGGITDVDGDAMLITAPFDEATNTLAPYEGAAYFYRWDGMQWTGEQRVKPWDQQECQAGCDVFFGWCTGLDGDLAVVGALFADYKKEPGIPWTGGAYIYRYDGVEWKNEQKVHGHDPYLGDWPETYDLFSTGCGASDDLIIVGAGSEDSRGSFSGSAYIFRYDPAGLEWEKWQLDGASGHLIDPDGAAGDRAGESADIYSRDGVELAIVGALTDLNESGEFSGSVRIYRYDPMEKAWKTDGDKLWAPGRPTDAKFGRSVAIWGDLAVVGALGIDDYAGATYVFRYDPDAVTEEKWVRVDTLQAPDKAPGDQFGEPVDIRDDLIVVGAEGKDNDTGAAYACHLVGPDDWECSTKLLPEEEAEPGATWAVVSTDGNQIVTGGYWDDNLEHGVDAGTVWIYRLAGEPEDPMQAVLDQLQALEDSGTLNNGQENSLANMIENAARQYAEQGNLDGACALLENFIRHVQRLVEQGVLSPEEGQRLIDIATALMEEYGC